MKINYQKELEKSLALIEQSGQKPKLLLHCCCAPCASYVLEYLSKYFSIIAWYYNPNISPKKEYDHRASELSRLVSDMNLSEDVSVVIAPYDHVIFDETISGLENEPEGGARCVKCFDLRLEKAAKEAKLLNCDYFATTLTISPLKNAELINSIGVQHQDKCGLKYLPSDFKKSNGYKRSLELSEKHGLYRQNYCGCVYSVR